MSSTIALKPAVAQEPPARVPAAEPVRATAQDAEAERKAAFESLGHIVKAYRDAKGVSVKVEVAVGAESEDGEGTAPSVKLGALFGEKRRAVISLRDYQLRFTDGKVVATHDSNPVAYLEVSDHGSPYYALFNAFQALPVPELALALGEDALEEVCMQLMPQVPDVQPVRVVDDEIDGQACKTLILESEDLTQELRLSFDPETKFIERSVGLKKGGPEVEEGAKLRFTVTSKAERPKAAPDAKSFGFDATDKLKVDGLAALISRDPAAVEDKGVAALKAGEPAPALALPKLGGGNWDILAARPKPVLVDFWATWCGPCRGALPHLAKLAEEFDGRAEFMLVNTAEQGSREEREANIGKVLGERKATRLSCVLDLDGQAARRWLVSAFPTTFIIAPDGKIAGVWKGTSPAAEREMHDLLLKLTGAKAAAETAPAPAPSK